MLLAPLQHLVQWLAYSTSMYASTRGAGALCRRYMYATSSLPAPGTMVCQRQVPLNGYGVSHAAIFVLCNIPLTDFCRFRGRKGHTSDDYQPRLQNLPYVRNCQHRCYGYLCIVRRGLLPAMSGEIDCFVLHT